MPINFNCSCGEKLEVDDELAGRQVRCPYCEAVVSVPAANAPTSTKRAKRVEPEDTDDDRGAFAGSLNPLDHRNRSSRRRRDDDEDDRPSRRPRDEDDDDDDRSSRRRRDGDDEDRPSRRRREPDDEYDDDYRPRRRRRSEPPRYRLFNNQTIGGTITVVISLAVFVGALFVDMFWWGMLIIAAIGFFAIIRGLASGRDG